MKDLCLITYVFGDKYQDYIPIFVFSIKVAYPQYDIFIFLNSKLRPEISKQLGAMNNCHGVKIIEDYLSDIDFKKTVSHGAAVRWLLWDEEFRNYTGLYVADIDIFYCREEYPIFQQHEAHCEKIDKPFSNVQRKAKKLERLSFRNLFRNLRDLEWHLAIKCFLYGRGVENRLTGLHYVRTSFQRKLLDEHGARLYDTLRRKAFFYNHPKGFNDESFLFDIIDSMGLAEGLPEAGSNIAMLEASPNDSCFRPHHGIHLGLFRFDYYSKDTFEILNSSPYKSYYNEFCRVSGSSDFLAISDLFSNEMKLEISRLHSYYQQNTSEVFGTTLPR